MGSEFVRFAQKTDFSELELVYGFRYKVFMKKTNESARIDDYGSRANMRVLILYPNLHMMLVPSVAVGLLTKICDEADVEVALFDTTTYRDSDADTSSDRRVESLQYREFDPENDLGFVPKPASSLFSDLDTLVDSHQPDLLLISVVEDTFRLARRMLKHLEPRAIPSLMGGVFPTAAPEKALSLSCVDAICVGEGETVTKAVIDRFKTGRRDFNGIPRVWTRDLLGKVCPPAAFESDALEDINRITPNFRLFDANRFNRPMGGRVFRTLPLETFRGCPFKCSFCNSPMQVDKSKSLGLGHFLRRKKIGEVEKIIENLISDYEAQYLYFVDDSFLSRPRREIDAFIKMYSRFKLPFWFNTRPESCTLEILEELKSVGLDRLSVGLEHGNEKFRQQKLLRKPSNEQLLDALLEISESDIAFSVNTMIGFPGETRDLVMDTINFCRSIPGADAMTVSIFTPYHGTRLRDESVAAGFLDDNVLTKHTTSSSILNMPTLSVDEIDGLFRTFMMYVKFEKEKFAIIREAEKLTDEGNVIWRELYTEYQERFFSTDQDGVEMKTNPSATIDESGIVSFNSDDWEEVFGSNSKSYSR